MAEMERMPFWTDAYLADTHHLTFEEHGVYLRLLILCWRTPGCTIPNDRNWCARHLRISEQEFTEKVKPVLDEFFTKRENRLFQKRLLEEYLRAKNLKETRARGAKAANQKKKQTRTPSRKTDAQVRQPASDVRTLSTSLHNKGNVRPNGAAQPQEPAHQPSLIGDIEKREMDEDVVELWSRGRDQMMLMGIGKEQAGQLIGKWHKKEKRSPASILLAIDEVAARQPPPQMPIAVIIAVLKENDVRRDSQPP